MTDIDIGARRQELEAELAALAALVPPPPTVPVSDLAVGDYVNGQRVVLIEAEADGTLVVRFAMHALFEVGKVADGFGREVVAFAVEGDTAIVSMLGDRSRFAPDATLPADSITKGE